MAPKVRSINLRIEYTNTIHKILKLKFVKFTINKLTYYNLRLLKFKQHLNQNVIPKQFTMELYSVNLCIGLLD